MWLRCVQAGSKQTCTKTTPSSPLAVNCIRCMLLHGSNTPGFYRLAVQILRNMQGYEGIGRHAVQELQDTVPESCMLHAER